ncbi:retrotransposon like family member (retr 1) [Plakobranchus ocellatus]|uniref:Retrotransposon like family member (Retr 1) n=1 Tax=Plakobranchus ocellatus TaxID=259542 RepID=A0AAV4DTQ8_9GAST|nr:retrotransposon like family member (retr 1) [Plakobranchus ocellatus]
MDGKIKQKQKNNYDKRHSAKPFTKLHQGQHVWITKPKHQEAVVAKQVETPWGQQRRNRIQLRRRDDTFPPESSSAAVPSAASTLLDLHLGSRRNPILAQTKVSLTH